MGHAPTGQAPRSPDCRNLRPNSSRRVRRRARVGSARAPLRRLQRRGGRRSGVAVVLTLLGVGDDPAALTDGQAFVLGIVQGLTELLPISSSGHLILVPWAADWTYLEQHDRFNQTFDVALHLGTLVAVGAYFWSDIVRLVSAWVALGRATAASRRPTSASPGSCSSRRFPPASSASRARMQSPTTSANRGRSSSSCPPARCFSTGRTDRRNRARWATSASARRSSWASPRLSRWRRGCRARGSRSPPAAS